MIFQRIALRLEDSAYPIPMKRAIPIRPTNRLANETGPATGPATESWVIGTGPAICANPRPTMPGSSHDAEIATASAATMRHQRASFGMPITRFRLRWIWKAGRAGRGPPVDEGTG